LAQQAQPLAKMALQEEELPRGVQALHAGPISFEDLSHPLNSENTLPVVHQFLEAYQISFLGEKIHGGHYLYRYEDPKQAEEQATRLVAYIWASGASAIGASGGGADGMVPLTTL